MATSSPINPYESPREAEPISADFSNRDAAEMADLRRRIAELERRVGRSWIVHSNYFVRACGVWAYFLLGYIIIIAIFFAIMSLIWLVTGKWLA